MKSDNIEMTTWYFRVADILAAPFVGVSSLVACVSVVNLLNSF